MKLKKKEVEYKIGGNEQHCGICTMFKKPDKCFSVKGKISPAYWCRLFERKSLYE